MRQLTLIGERRLEWLEVSEPELASPGGALVRPLAVAVCDFDRAVVAGRYPMLPFPMAIGHEIAGEVVAVGPEVRQVSVGARVALPLHISCGGCPSCRARRTNSCTSRAAFSNYGLGAAAGDWGGGMSDLLYVPYADAMAVPLPKGISPLEAAAVGCNLVDLYRCIAPHMGDFPDPTVLIVSGLLPNMAFYGVAVARALGVRRIHFLDDDEARLATAAALGAHPIAAGEGTRELYPIVVDASGTAEGLSCALRRVGPGGVCTMVMPPPIEAYELPVSAMFMRNATLIAGQPDAAAHLGAVVGLMAKGDLRSTSIPVEVLPWEDAGRTFGLGEAKRIFVRD